jgi:hypothetical protein
VGSRTTPEIEQARERRCLEWANTMRRQRPRPLRWVARGGANSIDRRLGLDAAGTYAARSIRRHGERTHAAALALVDELLTMGREPVVEVTQLQPTAQLRRRATPAAPTLLPR